MMALPAMEGIYESGRAPLIEAPENGPSSDCLIVWAEASTWEVAHITRIGRN